VRRLIIAPTAAREISASEEFVQIIGLLHGAMDIPEALSRER